MNKCEKGYYSQHYPGQMFSLEVEEVLHHEKSQYQDIFVFRSKSYGRVLVLDEKYQYSELDEFSYHEMLTHLPMFCHPNPKHVLVVGGGDGGVVKEVAKHSCVEEIHLCEVDERVVEVSKQYLPQVSSGFSDPRLKVYFQDGAEFMAQCKQKYDIIITDSPDDEGPALSLYQETYYENMKAALKPNGITSVQGDTPWEYMPLVKELMELSRSQFPVVSYAVISTPLYMHGLTGFVLASLNPDVVFEQPVRTPSVSEQEEMNLKYYTPAIHRAALTLPRFIAKALQA